MAAPAFMLDTNICIYIRRNRPQIVTERLQAAGVERSIISVVTYGELRLGAEKSDLRDRDLRVLTDLIARLEVVPMPIEAAEHYGSIRADLERRGVSIGNNDLWIAAHARSAGLTLVTNNEREFRRVPGLAVENWAAAA